MTKNYLIFWYLCLLLIIFSLFVNAVPAPDYTLYGSVTVNNKTLTLEDSNVITLKINGNQLASFKMGDVAADAYVLRIPMNTERTDGYAIPGDTANIYVDGSEVKESPVTIGDIGTTVKLDIHATTTYCGNGIVDAQELCDNGSKNGIPCTPPYAGTCTYCSDICKNITRWGDYCGDGTLDIGYEECDDGNNIVGDGCQANCKLPKCGDWVLDPGEECDWGPFNSNTIPGACRENCKLPRCEDGVDNPLEQCDDDNNISDNRCLTDYKKEYCGDGVINGSKQCNPPNTENSKNCTQSNTNCQGTKKATRDSYGNCNSAGNCVYDSFSEYQCVKGACGAECSTNSDCNDGNNNTTDICSGNCTCVHEKLPYCGDGITQSNEECELPGTIDDTHCVQSSQVCFGTKLGIRDSFGNCDAHCGCVEGNFTLMCIPGTCGAQCANNNDCNDHNPNTQDVCLDNCTCVHNPISMCGDGVINGNEQCELPNTQDNKNCAQSNTSCLGTKQATRDSYGTCNSVCGCVYDSFTDYQCVKGACGAECYTNADCNDENPQTTDYCDSGCVCHHDIQPYCGDDVINSNGQCELPNTFNNNYCTQSQTTCSDKKQGTRDAYGNCNSTCGCIYDAFSYQCIKGACGAECSTNADCNDGNSHTKDVCSDGCTCTHTLKLLETSLLVSKIRIVNGEDLHPSDELLTLIELTNNGETNIHDLTIILFIPDLDVYGRIESFNLNKGAVTQKSIVVEVPASANPGIYDVRIVVSNGQVRRVKYYPIQVVD